MKKLRTQLSFAYSHHCSQKRIEDSSYYENLLLFPNLGFCISGRTKTRASDWVSSDSHECYDLVKYENIIVIEKYKT